MKKMGYITAVYALIILTGGLVGFFTAHSKASLIASSIFAFFLIISALSLLKSQKWGYYMAVSISFILTIFFLNRFFNSYAFTPLLMTLFSIVTATALFTTRKEQKAI
jgi:uncharacterized membrane protein (UPF0136 family)